MKIELTKSQIAYLKSLDSKKNKRKFLLDCLVENIEIEETQKVKPIVFKDGVFETNDQEAIDFLEKCGFIKPIEEVQSEKEMEELVQKTNKKAKEDKEGIKPNNPFIDSINLGLGALEGLREFHKSLDERKSVKISDLPSKEFYIQYEDKANRKSNYSQEEIDLVTHNIKQRKLSEQGSELLKFDMLQESELMNIQCLSINDIVYNRKVPYAYVTNELMNFFKEIALNNINKYNKNAK